MMILYLDTVVCLSGSLCFSGSVLAVCLGVSGSYLCRLVGWPVIPTIGYVGEMIETQFTIKNTEA